METQAGDKCLAALEKIAAELAAGGTKIAEFPYPFLTTQEALYACLAAGRTDLAALVALGPDWAAALAKRQPKNNRKH